MEVIVAVMNNKVYLQSHPFTVLLFACLLVLFVLFFSRQIPVSDAVADSAVVNEPFVNYQERMTRAMRELIKKSQDMVRYELRGSWR